MRMHPCRLLLRKLLLVLLCLPPSFTLASPTEIFISPRPNQEFVSLPIPLELRLPEPVLPKTVSVRLNGVDITSGLRIGSKEVTGTIGIADGVVPSRGGNAHTPSPNALQFHARTQRGTTLAGARQFFVSMPIEGQVRATIGPSGGSLVLQERAVVEFPAGGFTNPQAVVVSATATEETDVDWKTTSVMFAPQSRLAFELRINTGSQRTAAPIDVKVKVPEAFLQSLSPDSELRLFAQVFQDEGMGILDSFELFNSSFANSQISATLPPEVFTHRRRTDGTFEAVVVVAALPTRTSLTSPLKLQSSEGNRPSPPGAMPTPLSLLPLSAATSECKGSTLSSPLTSRKVTSPFNPPAHYGVDYAASNGTPVLAMSDGIVERVGFDARPLPVPDPRSGKTVKGWGRFVVIAHSDGSRSLYAHMQSDGVQVSEGHAVGRGKSWEARTTVGAVRDLICMWSTRPTEGSMNAPRRRTSSPASISVPVASQYGTMDPSQTMHSRCS